MHLPAFYMTVTISTVPTEWYHLVFNYIGTNNAEGISTQKTPYIRNAGPGIVVIGRYFVQYLEMNGVQQNIYSYFL